MKKSLKLIVCILLFTITQQSCLKDNIKPIIEDIVLEERTKEFLDVIKKPYEGIIRIDNVRTGFNSDSYLNSQATATFTENNNLNTKSISFNSHSLELDENNLFKDNSEVYRNEFGKKAKFSLSRLERDPVEVEFYIPAELILQYAEHIPEIGIGKAFDWNEDPENLIGIHLIIDYQPELNGNNGGQRVTKHLTVEDNGSYSFTANDLAGIPSGALISFSIIRGDYRQIENSGEYYLLYAYSKNFGMVKME